MDRSPASLLRRHEALQLLVEALDDDDLQHFRSIQTLVSVVTSRIQTSEAGGVADTAGA